MNFRSHPHSIDALCNLPSSYPSSYSTILTGSSDGLLRAVQLFPTKLLGVVADHGEFPIERIAVDMGGEGHWVGSVGHDEVLRLTDLREVLEDEVEGEELEAEDESDSDSDSDTGSKSEQSAKPSSDVEEEEETPNLSSLEKKIPTERSQDSQDVDEQSSMDEEEADSDNDRPAKKRKTKQKVEDPLATDKKRKRKPRKDEVVADPTFFADL